VGLCPIWKYTTKNSGATRVETPMKTWSRYVPNATLEYTADTGEKRTVAGELSVHKIECRFCIAIPLAAINFCFCALRRCHVRQYIRTRCREPSAGSPSRYRFHVLQRGAIARGEINWRTGRRSGELYWHLHWRRLEVSMKLSMLWKRLIRAAP
jgi:hypothetical protein